MSEIRIYDDTDPNNPTIRRVDIDEHFKKEKDRIKLNLLVKGYKKIDEWVKDGIRVQLKLKNKLSYKFVDTNDNRETMSAASRS